MKTKQFWVDLAERALSTFAQSLLATLAVGMPVWDLDWVGAVGIALTATVVSVLKCLAAASTGQPDSASLVDATPVGGRHRAKES